MMISDINDPKIKFISDMISDMQSTKPHEEPTKMPESPDTSMSSKNSASSTYTLLDSLGINTNLDTNKEQLLNLLSEMVMLFKKNNQPMNFIHRGNDRLGLLVPIPRVKNYSTFDKMTKGQNWYWY